MMNEYKSRFESFTSNEFYVRADSDHPLDWNIGLDSNGHKALKLRGKFNVQKIEGTKFVQIQQFSKGEIKAIVFSLMEDSYSNQFYTFVEDMVTMSREASDAQEGYIKVIRNFARWKGMFQNCSKDYLTNERIMGLIAEILFLQNELIPTYGEEVAAKSWTGQELTHKDFYVNNLWYEVKAISVGKTTVKISSLEQLESSDKGYLIVYQLEKVSAESNGISLNQLVKKVYESMVTDSARQYFIEEVSKQGFAFHEYYDSVRYKVCEKSKYLVDEDFPKLTHNNVCDEVVKAEYHLNLGLLKKHIVG